MSIRTVTVPKGQDDGAHGERPDHVKPRPFRPQASYEPPRAARRKPRRLGERLDAREQEMMAELGGEKAD
jgi:hypothetical protein